MSQFNPFENLKNNKSPYLAKRGKRVQGNDKGALQLPKNSKKEDLNESANKPKGRLRSVVQQAPMKKRRTKKYHMLEKHLFILILQTIEAAPRSSKV